MHKKRRLVMLICVLITFLLIICSTYIIRKMDGAIKIRSLTAKHTCFFEDFGENDFTCTGLAYDLKNESFWIANYGNSEDKEGVEPQIIEVDKNFTRVNTKIGLPHQENECNLQGLTYDAIDDTLWIATGDAICEISKNGDCLKKIVLEVFTDYRANGIAIHDENIWILCQKELLININRDGKIKKTYNFDYLYQDHICYCDGMLYCTVGADYKGDNNYLLVFDLQKDKIIEKFQVRSSHAVEGVAITDGIVYIANDGKYHGDILGKSYISLYVL